LIQEVRGPKEEEVSGFSQEGFRVWVLGLRVLGFRVLGVRVEGLKFTA
jgi:hypothetical protein